MRKSHSLLKRVKYTAHAILQEDIDVGEDEKPDDLISHRARAERALENDHASMYTKVDQTDSWHHSYMVS